MKTEPLCISPEGAIVYVRTDYEPCDCIREGLSMGKGGRPMLADVVRYACGKINKLETAKALQAAKKVDPDAAPPNPRVKAQRDLFNARCFKGGGQAQHAGDPIGMLWLVGALDVPGFDETKLLSAAREWWNGREEVFKDVACKTARHEVAPRGPGTTKPTKGERAYYRYESFLRDASDYEYDCLSSAMEVETDGVPTLWVSRILQTRVVHHIRLPFAELSTDDDEHKLSAAKRALVALAGVEAIRIAA